MTNDREGSDHTDTEVLNANNVAMTWGLAEGMTATVTVIKQADVSQSKGAPTYYPLPQASIGVGGLFGSQLLHKQPLEEGKLVTIPGPGSITLCVNAFTEAERHQFPASITVEIRGSLNPY